jgi:hypothetical protein
LLEEIMGAAKRILPIAVVLLVAAAPAAGSAIYLAPDIVRADGDGSFRFTVTLVAGQDCVGWTGYGYWGEANVEAGFYADTFCMDPQPIEPGAELQFEVRGRLVDPTLPGAVWSESAFCTGGGGTHLTAVLAPSVKAGKSGWSALKSRYR